MAYSQDRALLVNTAGHANLDIDFGQVFGTESVGKDGKLADQFHFNGEILNCFTYNSQVVLYKNAKYWKTFQIGDKAIGMIFDNEKLLILVSQQDG